MVLHQKGTTRAKTKSTFHTCMQTLETNYNNTLEETQNMRDPTSSIKHPASYNNSIQWLTTALLSLLPAACMFAEAERQLQGLKSSCGWVWLLNWKIWKLDRMKLGQGEHSSFRFSSLGWKAAAISRISAENVFGEKAIRRETYWMENGCWVDEEASSNSFSSQTPHEESAKEGKSNID